MMGDERETEVYKSLREMVMRLSPKDNPMLLEEKRRMQKK